MLCYWQLFYLRSCCRYFTRKQKNLQSIGLQGQGKQEYLGLNFLLRRPEYYRNRYCHSNQGWNRSGK